MSEPPGEPGPYPTGIQHPAGTISVITDEAEGMVPVRRAELRAWATEIRVIAKNPLEYANAWATTALGIGLSALVSLALVAASKTATNHPPEWIYVLLLAVGLAGVGIAAFCNWVDRKQRKAHNSRAETLCGQIQRAEDRAPASPGAGD